MTTIASNASWASCVTTDSTNIPPVMVNVTPVKPLPCEFVRSIEELLPNDRVGGPGSDHGSVVTLGIHGGYVGLHFKEVVEDHNVF